MFGACTSPYPAIVMEWMGGGDLSQFLAQRPLPQLHRRLSLFRQICAGLNCLHSHSPDPIIHSDLKPANILLDSDQEVAKIADFGLSTAEPESSGSSLGTLLYFAPEMILDGTNANRPTDIYSMGLILWEILAGKLVWHNADGSPVIIVQLVTRYMRGVRPSLDEIPDGVAPAIIELMQECWANDPKQRPTADQLWRRMAALDDPSKH
jgi:serine/threonine protein kinase